MSNLYSEARTLENAIVAIRVDAKWRIGPNVIRAIVDPKNAEFGALNV